MDVIFVLWMISLAAAGINFPIACICLYLLIKYWKQEFLRIRGRKYRLGLFVSTLLFNVFVLYGFTYTYFYNDKIKQLTGNSIDRTNSYFLLLYQVLFFAMGIAALLQRIHVFSRFKIAS